MSRRSMFAPVIAVVAVVAVAMLVLIGTTRGRPADPPPSSSPAVASEDVAGTVLAHEHGLQFRYPAGWSLHHVTEIELGFGSSFFVLTSEPFPVDCVDPTDDLNCLFQHPLGPGAIRVEVGSASIIGGTFFDPLPAGLPAGVQVVHGVAAGMPALLIDQGIRNGRDVDLTWKIAMPDSVQRALIIQASANEPGAGALRRAAEQMVGSLVLDVRPAPVPTDPAGLAAAARAARVAAVAEVIADGGIVVMGDRGTSALDDCFEAGIDAPATLRVSVQSDVLPTGTVKITCTVSAELVGDAFWKVTITGRSGAGSTVPGTADVVTVWRTTDGEPAGDSWVGFVPAARAPGFLHMDAGGMAAAASLVTEFDADDSDFYQCFRAEGGTAITIGPDHRRSTDIVDMTCTSATAFAPNRNGFLVTLTAAWLASDRHPAGRMIVHLFVGTDGSIGEPLIEGDPLP